MGNIESQNGDHPFYEDNQGHLSRKHMSRSLRISNKQSRRSRHASSGKVEHRNSETSTRSSSTPSIPQSLAENGLELFNETNVLEDFGSPIWVDRVAMNLRPVSFHTESLVDSSMVNNTVQAAASVPSMQETKDSRLFQGEVTYLQRTSNGSCGNESVNFKKKRSKSADMWREDSLEFSLSDLSQEHLTSTEEIIDTTEKDCHKCERLKANSSPKGMETLDSSHRANSLDELYGQSSPGVINGAPRNRSVKYCRNLVSHSREVETSEETSDDKMLSPSEDDAASYGAYTLPCRRSHCLSEGAPSQQVTHSNSMQGRRAKTTQDVTTWEGSEYADSGIDGATTDLHLKTRRSKVMSATYSPSTCTGSSVFIGSDSGSSVGDALLQGVYENFRRELEMSSTNTESLEEALSAVSDEQSSGTMSLPGQSDILLTAAQGTVRKAGALAVKNFLVHKKNKKVELATRRKWKHYWVSLKGCTLFFYEADGRSGIDHNSTPKHAVWVENSIVQAVPEHPKKDFVFCLSNSLGDAFLFQTCSQTELENWITAIHSACATAVARQHHKDDTVKLLKMEIKKMEQKIDMDEKMKKMGEMQLSSVKDTKKRKTILEQIFLWEQNLEQFQMDLFRFRCYLSSLQGGELPNPKRLLAFASRPTKHAMGRLGIFSVSSFHALVFADGEDTVKKSLDGMFDDPVGVSTKETEAALNTVEQHNPDSDIWVPEYLTPSWVCLPNEQPVLAIIQPEDLPLDILKMICKIHQLDPAKYYVRLKFLVENQVQFYIPKPEEHIHDMPSLSLAISTVPVDKNKKYCSMPPLRSDGEEQLYSDIFSRSQGLKAGDEILQLNSKDASHWNVSDMKSAVSQPSLSLAISTVPVDKNKKYCSMPPLRSDGEEQLYSDIFSRSQENILDDVGGIGLESTMDEIEVQLEASLETDDSSKSTEQVAAFCRSLHDMNPSELSSEAADSSGPQPAILRQLTDADKLRKVICELVETERTYVKDLKCLIDRYLTPLQKETFLTQDELDVLFGNLAEMLEFQNEFLQTLEDGTRLKVLFSLGGSFLYYADRFKIYSAFCASHTKVPKVFVKAKTDPAFKAFLDAQNPTLTDPESEEHYHLDVAMKAMNKVASHINEVADLSMGDLLLHTTVVWLNPPASFGKWKKDPELAAFDAEGGAVCEVVHVKSESEGRPERTFHLCCSSPESKKDFLKTIHSVLRDKQRRQLLKTESLPPNQQYVPFGGKRLCALKGARPVMNRAVSAPSRTLGKGKLVRNRFTIDTDSVFECSPAKETQQQHQPQQAAISVDTDRWVEEQFDLDQYEDQEDVKETDILSDDDEYCKSVKGPTVEHDLPAQVKAVSLTDNTKPERENNQKTGDSRAMKMAHLKKQSAISGLSCAIENNAEEVIWVRREDFVPVRNSDI
ncbi:UNVERIFIED_CONTAM: hypothetical protein FKN15_068323 [Acipenser sinensis]